MSVDRRADWAAAPDLAAPVAAGGRIRGLWLAMRPRQWIKNGLVLAAPAAAGVVTQRDVLVDVALTFAAFSLVASAVYLVNDVADVAHDRAHAVKRARPIAAGVVAPRLALTAAALALLAGLALAAAVRAELLAVVAGYAGLSVLYTFWLKHVEVLDLAVVASGFIFRAVAGGVAIDVPISRWFLIVASFGSLFLVAGKRYSEHVTMGVERELTRATLAVYSPAYLRQIATTASSVTLLAYCLWAFERSGASGDAPLLELSVVPFTIGVLRYALLLDGGLTAAPEEVALRDRPIQLLGLIWAILFVAGVSVA
ncbi:MAG TPA: decaprenyl-phosphate phosphoribosyltransferase [Conexibacter sp.]